jgi:hypothetical protein
VPDATGGDGNLEADADAGVTAWCDTQPAALFCDDFDAAPKGARWSAGETTLGAASTLLDSTDAVSAPSSLLLEVPASSGVGHVESLLTHAMAASGSVSVSFDVRADSIDTAEVGIVRVQVGVDHNFVLFVRKGPGASYLQENSAAPPVFHGLQPGIAWTSGWQRVAIEIDDGSPRRASVRLDGALVLAPVDTTAPPEPVSSISLGAVWASTPTAGARIRFDDLAVD